MVKILEVELYQSSTCHERRLLISVKLRCTCLSVGLLGLLGLARDNITGGYGGLENIMVYIPVHECVSSCSARCMRYYNTFFAVFKILQSFAYLMPICSFQSQ